jgi:aminoglycoside 6'-N-acetyltransferase I
LAKDQDNYVGFIYLSMRREHIEGVSSFPVAYIEGIWVSPGYRRSGLGRILVEMGEKWGKENGCKQFASDTEWENEISIRFHKNIGFETSRPIVFFVKEIL